MDSSRVSQVPSSDPLADGFNLMSDWSTSASSTPSPPSIATRMLPRKRIKMDHFIPQPLSPSHEQLDRHSIASDQSPRPSPQQSQALSDKSSDESDRPRRLSLDSSGSSEDEINILLTLKPPLADTNTRTASRSERPRRAAVLRRGTYLDSFEDEDPFDAIRAPALASATITAPAPPKRRPKGLTIQALLKEKESKERRRIDERGLLEADALVKEMDRQALAILQDPVSTKQSSRSATTRTTPTPYLSDSRAGSRLSPADSSFRGDPDAWELEVSDVETNPSLGEFDLEQESDSENPNPKREEQGLQQVAQVSPPDARTSRLRDALLSAFDDKDDGLFALRLLHEDPHWDTGSATGSRRPGPKGRSRAGFIQVWRPGMIFWPAPEGFVSHESHLLHIDEAQLVSGLARHLYQKSDPQALRSIGKWAFFSAVLLPNPVAADGALDILSDYFQKSAPQDIQESTAAGIIRELPRLLVMLGAQAETIENFFCLPESLKQPPLVAKARTLTSTDANTPDGGDDGLISVSMRSNILTRLSRAISAVCKSDSFYSVTTDPLCSGLFISLAFILADAPYSRFRDATEKALSALMTETSPWSLRRDEEENTCDRILALLQGRSMRYRFAVLQALPAEGLRARKIRRWIAWRSLLESSGGSCTNLTYGHIIPRLGKLADCIGPDNPESCFYISPRRNESISGAFRTDYEELLAAAGVLGIALTDVALQICRSKILPSLADTPGSDMSPQRRNDHVKHSRALELALAPFLFLEPQRSSKRVAQMEAIYGKLREVHARVMDTNGSDVARSKARDSLQTLMLGLKYEVDTFAARPHDLNRVLEEPGKLMTGTASQDAKGGLSSPSRRPRSFGSRSQVPTTASWSPGSASPSKRPKKLSPANSSRSRSSSPEKRHKINKPSDKLGQSTGQASITSFLRTRATPEVVIPAAPNSANWRPRKRSSSPTFSLMNDDVSEDTPLRLQERRGADPAGASKRLRCPSNSASSGQDPHSWIRAPISQGVPTVRISPPSQGSNGAAGGSSAK